MCLMLQYISKFILTYICGDKLPFSSVTFVSVVYMLEAYKNMVKNFNGLKLFHCFIDHINIDKHLSRNVDNRNYR